MAKDFPYPEFMDKELMTSAYLVQLRGDDEDLVEKFHWASRMLLKLVALFKYLEPVISSGIRAIHLVKDLEERITLLQNEKLALEKTKQDLTSEVDELRGWCDRRTSSWRSQGSKYRSLKRPMLTLPRWFPS